VIRIVKDAKGKIEKTEDGQNFESRQLWRNPFEKTLVRT